MSTPPLALSSSPGRANYGLDAPGVIRNLLSLGGLLLVGAIAAFSVGSAGLRSLGVAALWTASFLLVEGLLMIWSSRVGKLMARDRLLDGLQLSGHERVLDVGCGRGLLLIGAAKRLPQGRALGIDLWSQTDLSGNAQAATLANAEAEGVSDRVEVHTGDMRQLPFPDGSIDVVIASMSVHNIPTREGRRAAMSEIARVLRPGGRVALQDFQKTAEYAEDLRAAGLTEVKRSGLIFLLAPPVRCVTGRKAG